MKCNSRNYRFSQRSLHVVEARMSLKALVQSFKDTITDPEKHMGKLNKDDRVSQNFACVSISSIC